MNKPSLKEAVASMSGRLSNDDLEHYAVTIVANKEGKPSWSVQSHWVGFDDDEHKIELRQASLVRASRLVKVFRDDLKQGCLVVETLEELKIFLLLGGHAVIEKRLAEEVLPEFLKAHPVARTGFTGFQATKDMPKKVFQRAPTKKQRMRVLKRDGYRCKICGRAPHNNVDITLHIHHIRPWADRGLTHDDNLITLCHTCHEGLDPHHEISLFGLLTESGELLDVAGSRKEHIEAVKQYKEESFNRARSENT
jgi:hypothetical protein